MAVTTVLVGDTNLQKRARPVEAFARIAPLLSQKEILFGHAEGMFTTRAANAARTSLLYKERWRHSTPKIATGFVEAGFDGVCFASNVCANRDDVRETIEAGKRAGLAFCGIGENARHARAPLFIEHSEATVALLSRTSVFWPHLVPATEGEPGAATVAAHTAYGPGRRALEMPGAPPIVHTWADPAELELLCSDIAAARSRADHVVLSVHWGVSGSHEVLEYQREIGRAAIDAGASLVFGHHPHVVQAVELHHGRPIFFSLGNFAFDWEKMRHRALDGALVIAVLPTRPGEVADYTVVPVSRDEDNLIADVSSSPQESERILAPIHSGADAHLRQLLQGGDGRLRFVCD